jgi:hypothetical protein
MLSPVTTCPQIYLLYIRVASNMQFRPKRLAMIHLRSFFIFAYACCGGDGSDLDDVAGDSDDFQGLDQRRLFQV